MLQTPPPQEHQWCCCCAYGMWLKALSANLHHMGKSSPVVLFRAQAFYSRVKNCPIMHGHCCKHFLLWYGWGVPINSCGIALHCTILTHEYCPIVCATIEAYQNLIMFASWSLYVAILIASVVQMENQWLQPWVVHALISIDRYKSCWPDSLIH